jgi:aspartyl aminopeptidase
LTDRSATFEPNKENHTKPILASSVVDQLFGEDIESLGAENDKYKIEDKHFKTLLNRISSDLKIERSQIVDFELNVIDTQPAQLVGLHQEFVSSPRLDNLGSSLVSLDAIIESNKTVHDNAEVSMIMLFDHEEIGSQSAQGADSNMAAEITQRIFESLNPTLRMSDYYRAIRRSFLLSADMAHGLHPNYSEKHQSLHAPKIHNGIVLKTNANQRYTTDTVSATIVREVAALCGVPM